MNRAGVRAGGKRVLLIYEVRDDLIAAVWFYESIAVRPPG
jgi:hypothetical protein